MRNAWVFDQKRVEVVDVIVKASSSQRKFEEANAKKCEKTQNGRQTTCQWSPPCKEIVKVNSDVVVFEDGTIGLGAIFRDDVGYVM